ncbi:hypothetical protein BDV19DRAFT_352509 [Aspergillus venezuelensis]
MWSAVGQNSLTTLPLSSLAICSFPGFSCLSLPSPLILRRSTCRIQLINCALVHECLGQSTTVAGSIVFGLSLFPSRLRRLASRSAPWSPWMLELMAVLMLVMLSRDLVDALICA